MSKQKANFFPDCTDKCQSKQHGNAISEAISKIDVTDTELCAYLNYICCCCESVRDYEGRTALHVAASCGRTDLVRWLVENRQCNINARDEESGYTALHRSIFYGRIDTAVELIKLGANLGIRDANGLTYLDHAMIDGIKPLDFSKYSGELYSWGSNTNNSLGSQPLRTIPEVMDVFHKEYPEEEVVQICINQFHSVILSRTGKAFSCGYGQGGRLGLGIQCTEVIPKPIHFKGYKPNEPIYCKICSISRDHSLFLIDCGRVYSCGLNKHRVLGQSSPPPSQLLVPKHVKDIPLEVCCVASGNYHSLAWNSKALFSWGFNAGQLGHPYNDQKYIVLPERVMNLARHSIKLVSASTGATVVYTEEGYLFALHQYQCRIIASRQLNIVQINVVGGKLSSSIDSDLSNESKELKVAVLTNTGNLLIWQESDPILRRCIFSLNRTVSVYKINLNINEINFVTTDGEAFRGQFKARKLKKTVTVEFDEAKKSAFHKFLEKDDCVYVKLQKIPRIHRAMNIESDLKGENFAVIQKRPYNEFKYPEIASSNMLDNLKDLLDEADECDENADVIFNVGNKRFPAHRYIVSSSSSYLSNLISNHRDKTLDIKSVHPDIFKQFLYFVYTRTCDLTKCGELKNESLRRLCKRSVRDTKKEIDQEAYYNLSQKDKMNGNLLNNPVKMLHQIARRFEVSDLQGILNNLEIDNYEIKQKKESNVCSLCPLKFDQTLCQDLYDIEVVCKDNKVVKAHKCILVARLEYFNNMLSTRWKGNEITQVTIPFAQEVIEALLEFLYTDSISGLGTKDIDQLLKLLILADQFFVTRLKNQCELILCDLLTLKNAVNLLSFAAVYNANVLKECCFVFITSNIGQFLEMHLLEDLDTNLLKKLSVYYLNKSSKVKYRMLTPYSTAPPDEDIRKISSIYPVDMTEVKEKQKSSSKKRLRFFRTSFSEKSRLENYSISKPSGVQNLSNVSPISDIQETNQNSDHSLSDRLRAITLANAVIKNEDVEEKFSSLSKLSDKVTSGSSFIDTFEFPLLNSPPKPSEFQNRILHRTEIKRKTSKLSQKERKRLSSESSSKIHVGSPPLEESSKNPWKVIPVPVSPDNSPKTDDMESIISNEKKRKTNLVKITNKLLTLTQLEDKAIDELEMFYGVLNMEDELISVERVSMGAIALPVWVPKSK